MRTLALYVCVILITAGASLVMKSFGSKEDIAVPLGRGQFMKYSVDGGVDGELLGAGFILFVTGSLGLGLWRMKFRAVRNPVEAFLATGSGRTELLPTTGDEGSNSADNAEAREQLECGEVSVE